MKNFRTFEKDDKGNELYLTDYKCDVCNKPSEVYVKLDNGYLDIYICKTCLSNGEDLWNKTFLEECKKTRQEVEK
jgi:hypothetical protein